MITIHLIVRYREESQRQPECSSQDWLRETMRHMARPCYTVLTPMVAFISLVVMVFVRCVWLDDGGRVNYRFYIGTHSGLSLLPATKPKESGKASDKTKAVIKRQPNRAFYAYILPFY